jgi:tetratricopeptide (TPR) repeat protein
LKNQSTDATSLASLLVRHPLHAPNGFHWTLLTRCYAAQGLWSEGEEAVSEAISKDEQNGVAWAVKSLVTLSRLGAEQAAAKKFSHGQHALSTSLSPGDFVEAHHAFDRALSCGCMDRALWVELGRQWSRHGWAWRAEQSYTRALQIPSTNERETASLSEKLAWLAALRRGTSESEREKQAATAIQSQMRGVLARKEYRKRKEHRAQEQHKLQQKRTNLREEKTRS